MHNAQTNNFHACKFSTWLNKKQFHCLRNLNLHLCQLWLLLRNMLFIIITRSIVLWTYDKLRHGMNASVISDVMFYFSLNEIFTVATFTVATWADIACSFFISLDTSSFWNPYILFQHDWVNKACYIDNMMNCTLCNLSSDR